MSDATTTFPADRTANPIRICPRTRWACPLHIHTRSCGDRFARPVDREERLARLILKVRATDRFRGHAGTPEQNQDRCDLEWLLCDALWDECRSGVFDADRHDGLDDPEVRQSAQDLYNDLMANARRASGRGDYGRLPVPGGPATTAARAHVRDPEFYDLLGRCARLSREKADLQVRVERLEAALTARRRAA